MQKGTGGNRENRGISMLSFDYEGPDPSHRLVSTFPRTRFRFGLGIHSLFSVEVGTPVARRPPHRSRRAVFPHRALQVNSLSHVPSGLRAVAENPAAADRNSVPSGKAFPAYSFPQCAVAALGSAPASSGMLARPYLGADYAGLATCAASDKSRRRKAAFGDSCRSTRNSSTSLGAWP